MAPLYVRTGHEPQTASVKSRCLCWLMQECFACHSRTVFGVAKVALCPHKAQLCDSVNCKPIETRQFDFDFTDYHTFE